jgi:tetratricopeptide (TPR) repeat protein
MPSPRPTAHVLLPAMAVLVLCAVPAAQVTPTPTTVEALIEAGRYAEAESEAVRELDRVPAADADTATGRLIETLLRNGRGHEARTTELAARLVHSYRLRGAPGGDLATSLRRLGEVQYQSGEYAMAVVSLREAIAAREAEAEPNLSQVSADLEQLVEVLTDEIARDPKTLDEALTLAERALAIRQRIGEDVGTAHALRARGAVWQSKADFAKARADFEQSLSLYEQLAMASRDSGRPAAAWRAVLVRRKRGAS